MDLNKYSNLPDRIERLNEEHQKTILQKIIELEGKELKYSVSGGKTYISHKSLRENTINIIYSMTIDLLISQ